MIQLNYRPRHNQAIAALLAAEPKRRAAYAKEVEQWAREANQAARLAGLDADGQPLRAVKLPREWPGYKGATGPPMVPHGLASRAILGFFSEVRPDSTGFTVRCGIRGRGVEVLGYHATGTAGTGRKGRTTGVRRDVFGIPPRYLGELREINQRHVSWLRQVVRRAASFVGLA